MRATFQDKLRHAVAGRNRTPAAGNRFHLNLEFAASVGSRSRSSRLFLSGESETRADRFESGHSDPPFTNCRRGHPAQCENSIVGHGLDRPDQLTEELWPGQNCGAQVGRDLASHREQHVGILIKLMGEFDERLSFRVGQPRRVRRATDKPALPRSAPPPAEGRRLHRSPPSALAACGHFSKDLAMGMLLSALHVAYIGYSTVIRQASVSIILAVPDSAGSCVEPLRNARSRPKR